MTKYLLPTFSTLNVAPEPATLVVFVATAVKLAPVSIHLTSDQLLDELKVCAELLSVGLVNLIAGSI